MNILDGIVRESKTYYKNIFTNEIITSERYGEYLFEESKKTGKLVLKINE